MENQEKVIAAENVDKATADNENTANAQDNNSASNVPLTNDAAFENVAPATLKSANSTLILQADIVPPMTTLADYTLFIKGVQNRMKKDLMAICVAINQIKDGELFKEKGYQDVFEYAERELGYSRDTVNKYTSVAQWFIEKTGEGYKSVFFNGSDKDFSVGSLIELLPLRKNANPVEVAKAMIASGELTTEMSSSEIRKIVKEKLGRKKRKSNKTDSAANDSASGVDEKQIEQIAERQNRISEISENVSNAVDELKKEFGESDNLLAIISAQREMAEMAATAPVKTSTSDNAEIELLKKQIAELQAQNQTLQAENSTLREENQTLQESIKTFDAQKSAMKDIYDAQDYRIKQLQAENETLQSKLENATVEEKIGEEIVTSKGKNIISIVNTEKDITLKYAKNGSHYWYQGKTQIKREKAFELIGGVINSAE